MIKKGLLLLSLGFITSLYGMQQEQSSFEAMVKTALSQIYQAKAPNEVKKGFRTIINLIRTNQLGVANEKGFVFDRFIKIRPAIKSYMIEVIEETNFLKDAILMQYSTLVEKLLSYGVNPNAVFPHPEFGQLTAVETVLTVEQKNKNSLACLQHLIDAFANLETRNLQGHTPLIRAAFENMTEIAITLLKGGADVNAKSSRSQKVALEYACDNNNIKLVQLLVGFGTDLSLEKWSTNVVLKNLPAIDDETLKILLAAAHNNPNIRIPYVDKKDNSEWSFRLMPALHFLVMKFSKCSEKDKLHSMEMIQHQLERGYNIDELDSSRYSALYYAMEQADENMINLLLDKGIYSVGYSTLYYPLNKKDQEHLHLLVKHGRRASMAPEIKNLNMMITSRNPLSALWYVLIELKKRNKDFNCQEYNQYCKILKNLLDHAVDPGQAGPTISGERDRAGNFYQIAMKPLQFCKELIKPTILLQKYAVRSLVHLTLSKMVSYLINKDESFQKNYISNMEPELRELLFHEVKMKGAPIGIGDPYSKIQLIELAELIQQLSSY